MAAPAADLGTLARSLLESWQDGAIKLYVILRALNFRKEHHALFKDGSYTPLAVDGSLKELACAFARLGEDETAITVVPRFLTRLLKSLSARPFGRDSWGDTFITIPDEIAAKAYRNIFTGETITTTEQDGKKRLPLGEAFVNFPVALLEKTG